MSRTINLPIDKDDKSTIISVSPYEIIDLKPGIYPGNFHIPKCIDDKAPVCVTIGASIYYIQVPDLPSVPVITSSYEMSKSIVEDYFARCLAVDIDAKPGIMYMRGEIPSKDFKLLHGEKLKGLIKQQDKWFAKLVELADRDWHRYKNPKVISDQQRYACTSLQLEREWNVVIIEEGLKCPACGFLYAKGLVVCKSCRCILDNQRYSELKFAS